MKLYLNLLRHFLSAGLSFGIIIGLFMTLTTNWKLGLGYGVASGGVLLLGAPLILTYLSVRKRRLGGANSFDASQ